jgi:hypothetical protein
MGGPGALLEHPSAGAYLGGYVPPPLYAVLYVQYTTPLPKFSTPQPKSLESSRLSCPGSLEKREERI